MTDTNQLDERAQRVAETCDMEVDEARDKLAILLSYGIPSDDAEKAIIRAEQ